MDPLPDPSRHLHVAIVRLTSLGDVIHGLPVAAAIRHHLPGTRITWLVEEREQVLLRDSGVVDNVVVVPLRRWRQSLSSLYGWRRSVAELQSLSRHLKSGHIDVAIDMQGWVHKTSPLTLLTRAPIRIGFDRAHARDPFSPLATNRHVTPLPVAKHIVDQNLALLGPVGVRAPGPAEFPLPAYAEAEARAEAWRRARGVGAQHRLVVLLPSTRGNPKRWPADRYRELGGRLLNDPSVLLLILGGPGEERLLETVREGLPAERAFVFAPEPIPDLVAMIRHTHLAIGNDTGPLHVAAASEVPAFGLFGPTRGERNGPYGSHCGYLQSPTARMDDLSVDEVWKRISSAPPRSGTSAATSLSNNHRDTEAH